jgi:hypothetical protein
MRSHESIEYDLELDYSALHPHDHPALVCLAKQPTNHTPNTWIYSTITVLIPQTLKQPLRNRYMCLSPLRIVHVCDSTSVFSICNLLTWSRILRVSRDNDAPVTQRRFYQSVQHTIA